jgi:hypothetical protein
MSEAANAKDARGILNTAGPEALYAAVRDAVPVEFVEDSSPKTPQIPQNDHLAGLLGASGAFESGVVTESDSSEVGSFPTDVLPPVIRDIIRETSRVTQTPDALGAVVALGILSAAFGGGLLVRSGGGRITPPNLFLLGIARSGTGKSRAFSIVAEPLLKAEQETLGRWIEHEKPRIETELRVTTKRAEAKEKEAAKEPDSHARQMLTRELQSLEEEKQRLERERDAHPCFSVGDVTREKLSQALSGQPGEALASLSADARGIIGVVMGRYSNGKSSDEDIYLSGYSGDSIKVDRLSRAPVMLHAPRLSLVWLIQPDIARALSEDERMTESGLLPRLLLCDVKAESADEPEDFPQMDLSIADAWSFLIRELLAEYRENGSSPRTIDVMPDAREVLRTFTNESKARMRPGGDLRDVDSYVARWGENAWRMALCLHGAIHGKNAHQHSLGLREATSAVEIIRWFSRAQLDVLATSRSDKAKVRLGRVSDILRAAGGCQTLRILRKSNGFEEEEVRALAARFPNLLRLETKKTGGRDSIVVRIPTSNLKQS